MPRKRILESVKPDERAKQRRKLGTLRELTVQPATRKRYDNATDLFLTFLRAEGHVLPTDKRKMDPLVCDYVEHLWSTGAGRGLACDTLAGLQDLQPNLKNSLPGAWRLLKTWHVNEEIANLTAALSAMKIKYQLLEEEFGDPSLRFFLAAKATKVYQDPGIQGAANKTFKYVLPHVSEALKTGEEVYSAMNASVLEGMHSLLGSESSVEPWLPLVSAFLVYGMICCPVGAAKCPGFRMVLGSQL
eukprot:s5827_g1.t1